MVPPCLGGGEIRQKGERKGRGPAAIRWGSAAKKKPTNVVAPTVFRGFLGLETVCKIEFLVSPDSLGPAESAPAGGGRKLYKRVDRNRGLR